MAKQFHGYGTQEFAPPPVIYQSSEHRIRMLVASGAYAIIKMFRREDEKWPFVYLISAREAQNTLHIFAKMEVK
jgi:hypothetical protein